MCFFLVFFYSPCCKQRGSSQGCEHDLKHKSPLVAVYFGNDRDIPIYYKSSCCLCFHQTALPTVQKLLHFKLIAIVLLYAPLGFATFSRSTENNACLLNFQRTPPHQMNNYPAPDRCQTPQRILRKDTGTPRSILCCFVLHVELLPFPLHPSALLTRWRLCKAPTQQLRSSL